MKLEELKYPKKGEKIFKEGTNMRKTAYIDGIMIYHNSGGILDIREGRCNTKNAICDSSNLVLDTSIFQLYFT